MRNTVADAATDFFSREAYGKAAEPKELFVVDGATHGDLYDQPQYMAQSLEKLNAFFTDNLK